MAAETLKSDHLRTSLFETFSLELKDEFDRPLWVGRGLL
jgi:hypothetical protein